MTTRDVFHKAVKKGLQKDGWIITHDPLYIRMPGIQMYIDLGAERVIGAQKGSQKIAVEVKSFLGPSTLTEFHAALGQYLNYQQALEKQEAERTLYMAVPLDIYDEFFKLLFVQEVIQKYNLRLIIYEPKEEVLIAWET